MAFRSLPPGLRQRVKLHAQAVLSRADADASLQLAGVLVAGSFYSNTAQDAWGPLHREVGLIALGPLNAVLAVEGADAVGQALVDARLQWRLPAKSRTQLLTWRPIATVRERPADENIAQLIEQMAAANGRRVRRTPIAPPYHLAARELEDTALRDDGIPRRVDRAHGSP